jgi:ribose-phosphate pyrophosphokinase
VRARRLELHRFPDGESLVRARVGAREAIVVRSLHDPDAKLVQLLLAADALRRAGARRVLLVAPYLAYMRQDRVFRVGEPVSQRVVARLLAGAFDRVLTVEAHLHRTRRLADVFPCPARSLSAAPLVARWCLARPALKLVVGPDEESAPWVRAVARRAGLPWAVGRKRRLGDRRVRLELPETPDLPDSARCLVVDDVASTGGTLAALARLLRGRGVGHVDAFVVHALFAPGALRRVRAAGIERVASCDTVAHATNRIGVAPLLAGALMRERR